MTEAVFCIFRCLDIFFLFVLFLLPHGEFAGTGESGVNPEARQNPAVENIPGGKYANQRQQRFHNHSPL